MMFGFKKKSAATADGPQLAAGLQDDKRRFEIIVNSIEDGVILIDSEQTIQLINPGAATISGWPANEATTLNVKNVIKLVTEKGDLCENDQNPFNRVFRQQDTVRDHNANMLNRAGKQLSVSLTISPLVDEHKQVTAAVVVLRDVSQERAEEKQRADFISTASHEMRTPVAAIEGYLSLALNAKVSTIDNKARDYLEKAHSSAQHLGQLFQDLLTSAKAEDGRLTSHPTVVEMGEFLEQLSNDLRFAAEKKGLFMEFAIGSSNVINASRDAGQKTIKPLYYVYADGDRLREVITNLFDNAVKYTEEGRVTIGLTGNNQVAQCYVRDTGPGIPADDVPHLFQKFYRVDNSATRTIGGTGLGLFICRKIVELYNGRIWVESEVGKGSTFYINLPRLNNDRAHELQAAAERGTEVAPVTPTKAS
jgi:PAS domain S-box-containing protein